MGGDKKIVLLVRAFVIPNIAPASGHNQTARWQGSGMILGKIRLENKGRYLESM